MIVGCWDCGQELDVDCLVNFERPRSAKSGKKSTVDVCERCFVLWHLKQARKESRAAHKGNFYDSKPIKVGIDIAIKFLEAL